MEHISLSLRHLPPAIDTFIFHLPKEYILPNTITRLVSQYYGKIISEQCVFKHRDNLSYSLLKSTSELLYRTPVEYLIAELSLKPDVSSIYITHNIGSRCVTHRKQKMIPSHTKYHFMKTLQEFIKMMLNHG